MQIGYGILLDGEIYNFMRKMELLLFDRYKIQKGLCQPPHITIKPPFTVDDISVYQTYLDELCQKIEPFDIELEGFNSFGKKVIYLDVKKSSKLDEIYQTIFSDIRSKFNPEIKKDDMVFHATLAYDDLNEESFDEAYEYLKSNFQPKFTMTAGKVGLFYQLVDDSGWIVIRERSLKNIKS
jgi:2'-5' RNA ligase